MRAIRPILEQELATIPLEPGFLFPCPVVLTIPIPFPDSHFHRRHGAEDTQLVRTCIPDGGLDAIGVHEQVGPSLPVPYGRFYADPLAVAHEVKRLRRDECHSIYWRVHPREWFRH